MIRREIGADGICMLSFDRPESGANIFDAATMNNLREHLDAIEKDNSMHGRDRRLREEIDFHRWCGFADAPASRRKPARCALSLPKARRSSIGSLRSKFRRWPRFTARAPVAATRSHWPAIIAWPRDDPATRIGLPETTLGPCARLGRRDPAAALDRSEAAAEVILKGKLYAADEALSWDWWMKLVRATTARTRAQRNLRAGKRRNRRRAGRDDRSSQELGLQNNAEMRRRTRLRNHQQGRASSIEESLADGAGCDR